MHEGAHFSEVPPLVPIGDFATGELLYWPPASSGAPLPEDIPASNELLALPFATARAAIPDGMGVNDLQYPSAQAQVGHYYMGRGYGTPSGAFSTSNINHGESFEMPPLPPLLAGTAPPTPNLPYGIYRGYGAPSPESQPAGGDATQPPFLTPLLPPISIQPTRSFAGSGSMKLPPVLREGDEHLFDPYSPGIPTTGGSAPMHGIGHGYQGHISRAPSLGSRPLSTSSSANRQDIPVNFHGSDITSVLSSTDKGTVSNSISDRSPTEGIQELSTPRSNGSSNNLPVPLPLGTLSVHRSHENLNKKLGDITETATASLSNNPPGTQGDKIPHLAGRKSKYVPFGHGTLDGIVPAPDDQRPPRNAPTFRRDRQSASFVWRGSLTMEWISGTRTWTCAAIRHWGPSPVPADILSLFPSHLRLTMSRARGNLSDAERTALKSAQSVSVRFVHVGKQEDEVSTQDLAKVAQDMSATKSFFEVPYGSGDQRTGKVLIFATKHPQAGDSLFGAFIPAKNFE